MLTFDEYFLINFVGCLNCRRRCKKYYIKGERKGSVDIFIDNLPGAPDNLRYDGEGHYWIALATVIGKMLYLGSYIYYVQYAKRILSNISIRAFLMV